MNKQQILEALKKAREGSKKRNFSQSIDIIFNLKDLDLKKPDHHSLAYIQRLLSMEVDGDSSLLDIAERWGYNFMEIYDEFCRLYSVGIFTDKKLNL